MKAETDKAWCAVHLLLDIQEEEESKNRKDKWSHLYSGELSIINYQKYPQTSRGLIHADDSFEILERTHSWLKSKILKRRVISVSSLIKW